MYNSYIPSSKKIFKGNYIKKIFICILIIIIVFLLKKLNFPVCNKILSQLNHYVFVVNYDINDLTQFVSNAANLKKNIPVFNMTKNVQMISPVENGKIVSGFGMRMHPILKVEKEHKGIDIAQEEGAPVRLVLDGEIILTGKDKELGNFIKAKHKNGIVTVYAHLRDIYVKKGEKISQGSVIGTVGNSGLSESFHLHFEVLKNNIHQDPEKWLQDSASAPKVTLNDI